MASFETKLVYSIHSGSGEHAAIAEITQPLIMEYAERCGADYRVAIVGGLEEAVEAKYELAWLLGTYDRILYVDNDVVISPGAPSIFDAVIGHGLAALNEARYFEGRLSHVQATHQVNLTRYFNGGVMLLGQHCHEMFAKVPPIEMHPAWYEQCYLNIAARDIGFTDLGPMWNYMTTMPDPGKTPYFRHAAGKRGKERLELIKSWTKTP